MATRVQSAKIRLGPVDLLALAQLRGCRFHKGSFADRFSRSLGADVDRGRVFVTRLQLRALRMLYKRYRRSLQGPALR